MEAPSTTALVSSYKSQRKLIGFIPFILPFILVIGGLLLGFGVLPSISLYYYSKLGTVFTGLMYATAAFMWTYRGFDRRDLVCSRIASGSMVAIATFPTDKIGVALTFIGCTHYAAAALLFSTLAYINFFLFTLSTDKKRNWVYYTCGGVIVACTLACPILGGYILIPEAIALVAFGISWLVKGW